MKKHQIQNKSGFTLIEVLVAIVIMLIIMAMIIYPFISSTGYLAKARARAEVQQVARDALDAMTRELAEAMDIYLLPADPSICAFVPTLPDTFPLQPDDKIIRYWLVWRSDPNADTSGVIPANSPIGKSWYEKFSPNPRDNQATAEDTDSRYIARTAFNYSNSGGALDLNGLPDSGTLNRDKPAKSISAPPENTIENRQYFTALTPDEPDFDIPILRFAPTPQVNETLQKGEDAYIYKSKYPLWEGNWQVSVYNSSGTLQFSFSNTTAIPVGVGIDLYTGRVSFVQQRYQSFSSGTTTLYAIPIIDSEKVVVGGQIYKRVYGIPVNNEYNIIYNSGASSWELNVAPAGSGAITYQQAVIYPTDIVVASYATRALLNISLTASKRDTQSGLPQTIHLQQKVKLKNVVR